MRNCLTTLVLALTLSACSQTKPYTGEKVEQADLGSGVKVTAVESRSILPGGGLAGGDATITEVTAKVSALNLKTRLLTLKSLDGKSYKIKAGPEVRNLPQVKVGDTVRLAYMEAIDFQVRQPTPEEIAMANQGVVLAGRAPKGSNPAGVVAAGAIKIVTIEAIDKVNSLVTLKEGTQLLTVKAKYPQNLASVKAGDSVVVTISELIAAEITPVQL
jgi:hypothetical protein